MLDPIWSLVIASALGMIGGLIPYKLFVSHLEESSSEEEFSARRQQGYYRYLIRHVSTQAIPILFYCMACTSFSQREAPHKRDGCDRSWRR